MKNYEEISERQALLYNSLNNTHYIGSLHVLFLYDYDNTGNHKCTVLHRKRYSSGKVSLYFKKEDYNVKVRRPFGSW